MSDRIETLKKRFIVDEPPPPPAKRRRVFSAPTPRAYPPQTGVQLLTWMTEEADEQMQLGAKRGRVNVSRRDLTHLRALLAWLPKRPDIGPDARATPSPSPAGPQEQE